MQQFLHQLSNPQAAQQYLAKMGVGTQGMPPAELIQMARNFAINTSNSNARHIANYRQNLGLQQQQQGLIARSALGGGPQAGQPGTVPMVTSGMAGGVPFLDRNTNTSRVPTKTELEVMENNAKEMGGTLQHPSNGSHHSLHDYQNQLMVLEQQNKRRLVTARQDPIRPDDPNFAGPGGPGGLQPGHPHAQATSMSPSNSHTGPSPRMPNMELGQQPQQARKPGQQTASGGASPETGETVQIRNPSPAFHPQNMTPEQFQQMAQMGGYPPGMIVTQNGQQFMSQGRPHQMQFNQQGGPTMEMLKQRVQPGQPYPAGWPNHMMTQQMNAVRVFLALTNL
jgi:hypothetical protein